MSNRKATEKKMGGYKKIHEHPKANSAGFMQHPEHINRTGENAGLTASTLKELREMGVENVTLKQIKDTYLSLLNTTIEDLKEIKQGKRKTSALVRVTAGAILSGKGFEIIERMIDRALGKADENIKVEGTGGFNVIFENYGIDKTEKKTKKE